MTKVSYLRDEYNDNCVLTIVRNFDKEQQVVKYGWSINVPDRWEPLETKEFSGARRIKGDQFCKKTGRELASARLTAESAPIVKVEEGQLPLEACLRDLCFTYNSTPFAVRRIARQHLRQISEKEIPSVSDSPAQSWLDRFMNWFRG